ncbi:unnamed protein product [Caenorhabditis bovis]|uniref:F-box domain-containing protein n=1 Tax=Caenorhabditis bovis TaxID=2654633 RepID=A0A8S1EQ17_9PELO|nr:unnamed protein product [Caenorhabditis bovis]
MFPQSLSYFPNLGINFELPTFSLDDLREDIVQNAPLLSLGDENLDRILSYVPLKERLNFGKVCKKFNESAKRTIKSIAFFRDGLDHVDDAKIAYFLSKYGQQIEYLNFDLFRSTSLKEFSQWAWRQSVIQSIQKCTNLRHLDILICTRHRLRDGDLNVIFKSCPHLETLKMDGQYIIGHSFTKAPVSLRHLEIEQCYRFVKYFFLVVCSRLRKLKVLHVSQLTILDEKGVLEKMTDILKNVEELSIVGDASKNYNPCALSDIRKMGKLKTLCLEGLNLVTDKFLAELSDHVKSPAAKCIQSISLAYCKNISSTGISKLAGMERLRNLNLDGILRDISLGIMAHRKLERLFLSDNTLVDEASVLTMVQNNSNLRLLDTSNNLNLASPMFGQAILEKATFAFRSAKLIILTDLDGIWTHAFPEYLQRDVQVVHLYRHMLPYLPGNSVISIEAPHQLPDGVLMPNLRRGNRFRMLQGNNLVKVEPMIPDDSENQFWSEIMTNFSSNAALFNEQAIQELNMLNAFAPMNQQHLHTFDTFRPDTEHLLNMLTLGSGGAPRPPTTQDENVAPIVVQKYRRENRAKRSNEKKKRESRTTTTAAPKASKPPVFTDADFPPLC